MYYKVSLVIGEFDWFVGDLIGWKELWVLKLFELVGDLVWIYYQYGIDLMFCGIYVIYDNGGQCLILLNELMFLGECYSCIVEYCIDEEVCMVEQVWEYGLEQEWFMLFFILDVDLMFEMGNVLIIDGGCMVDNDGNQFDCFGGCNWVCVFEVIYGDDFEKVWEFVIDDFSWGYLVYWFQRLVSFYLSFD